MQTLENLPKLLGFEKQEDLIDTVKEHKWVIVGCVAAGYAAWKYLQKPKNLPPGPIPWPILGTLTQLTEPVRMHLDWDRLRTQYGDVFTMSFGNRYTIVLNGNALKEAFNKAEFSDRPQDTYMNKFLGLGDLPFFLPYSEKLVATKKSLANGLRKSGWGTPKAEEKVMSQVQLLLDMIQKSDGKPMLIDDKMFVAMTTNISLSVFIGEALEWDDPKYIEFVENAGIFMDTMAAGFFADFASGLFPWWFLDLILYSKKKQSVTSRIKAVQLFKDVVADHRRSFDENNLRDFLDEYLVIQKKEGFSDDTLAETLMLLSLDSVYVVPAYLSWTLFFLASNPHVQQEAKKHMLKVCGGRKARLSDRPQLPYLDAIVREILRMANPSAISGEHTLTNDMTLRGYSIPKSNNVRVMANFYSLHMNENFHSEPTKFNPDRFINIDGSLKLNNAVYPFSVGPRACMGEQMVKSELWLFIANLLNEFSFQPPEGEKMNTVDDYVGKTVVCPKPFNLCFKPY